MDEHQRLRDMRMLFQYAAEDEFRSAVEAITGRKVTAFRERYRYEGGPRERGVHAESPADS